MNDEALHLTYQLPPTKFQPPQWDDRVIPRPRLLVTLNQAIAAYPLTLIVAPAGYGKTTLLTEWIHQFRIGAFDSSLTEGQNPQTTWLSLEPADNDPVRLILALITALGRLHPACGQTVRELLLSGSVPWLNAPSQQIQPLIKILVDDLVQYLPGVSMLIIEDIHWLTEAAAQFVLTTLLDQIPPPLRLVLSARRPLPFSLAARRVQRQIVEFDLADLAFTLPEMTTWLNDHLRLNLSPANLDSLQRRTEGWPMGLRLLATTLSEQAGPAQANSLIDRLPAGLTGLGIHHHIFEYLAAEALNRQPPPLRAFLLQTSILPELTPALCQAVTGRPEAPDFLEALQRQNLFLTAITEDQKREADGFKPTPWTSSTPGSRSFRYHDLWADFLRHRLSLETPELIVELRRRAAQAEPRPERQVEHYLAARLWEEAAQVIESTGETLVQQGLLETLTRWLETLPPQVCESYPRLLYVWGTCAWQKNQLERSRALLEQALLGFAAVGDEVGRGRVLANLVHCAMLQGDSHNLQFLFEQALACPLRPADHVLTLMSRGWVNYMEQDWVEAATDFNQAITFAQESDDRATWRILTLAISPSLTALPGGLAQIERVNRHVLTRFAPLDNFWQVVVEAQDIFSQWQRGRLEQVAQTAPQLLSRLERLGSTFYTGQIDMLLLLAGVAIVRRNYAEAQSCFTRLFNLTNLIPYVQIIFNAFLYWRGRAYWLEGRLAETRQVYEQMRRQENAIPSNIGPMLLPLLAGLLALAERDYESAERHLGQAAGLETQFPLAAIFGSARLMLAHLYLTWGRPDQALAELAPVLAECEQEDTPGVILQEGEVMIPLLRLAARRGSHAPFALRVLNLFGVGDVPRPVYVPETGRRLTRREVEVLELLAAGLTNTQIAGKLVLSLPAVKGHVGHILHKLNITTRHQAVARARALGIINDR